MSKFDEIATLYNQNIETYNKAVKLYEKLDIDFDENKFREFKENILKNKLYKHLSKGDIKNQLRHLDNQVIALPKNSEFFINMAVDHLKIDKNDLVKVNSKPIAGTKIRESSFNIINLENHPYNSDVFAVIESPYEKIDYDCYILPDSYMEKFKNQINELKAIDIILEDEDKIAEIIYQLNIALININSIYEELTLHIKPNTKALDDIEDIGNKLVEFNNLI